MIEKLIQLKEVLIELVVALTLLVSLVGASLGLSFGGVPPQAEMNPAGWNFNKKIISENEQAYAFHIKWTNYKSPTGWKSINTDFSTSSDGTLFEMRDAPFEVEAPITSNGVLKLISNNRHDVLGKKEITEPPLIMTLEVEGETDVIGNIERGDLHVPLGVQKDVSYVRYKDAYPCVNLIYYVDWSTAPTLEHLLEFYCKPTEADYSLIMEFDKKVVILPEQAVAKGKGLKIAAENSNIRGIGIHKIQMWDDDRSYLTDRSAVRNIKDIDSTIQPLGQNRFRHTKTLDLTFFDTATYPVYANPTYGPLRPDAGDGGNITVDGMSRYQRNANSGEPWLTIIRSDPGDNANVTAVGWELMRIRSDDSGNTDEWRINQRGFFAIDTSSIGDDETVDEADFVVTGNDKADAGNRDPNVNIFDWIPDGDDDTNTVAAADYANISTTTVFSTAIAVDSWSITLGNIFIINESGRSNISLTATTSWAIFNENFDADEIQPTWSAQEDMSITGKSADTTGNDKDPVLNATTSVAVEEDQATTYIIAWLKSLTPKALAWNLK